VVVLCVFFFFQAEDGIRDRDVTGVQTCALPICLLGSGFGIGDANTILVQDGMLEGVSDPRNVGGVAGY